MCTTALLSRSWAISNSKAGTFNRGFETGGSMSYNNDGDLQMSHSTINEDIPINRSRLGVEVGDKTDLPWIDAAYVPTLGRRPHLLGSVQKLLSGCKHVYILLSGDKPVWMTELPKDRVSLIDRISVFDWPDPTDGLSSVNPSKRILANYDIPQKRNFALWHARRHSYGSICLIDDDIIFDERQLACARYLISQDARLVGFYALDFPDVATISHVERFIRNVPSRVSVGGNFLFLKTSEVIGFFPYTYNDDWVFLFINMDRNNEVMAGGIIGQLPHEPWKDPTRIKFEQFGEILITGLIKRIATRLPLLTREKLFWMETYTQYLSDLEVLMASTTVSHWRAALRVALDMCNEISPSDLTTFVINLDADIRSANYV